jgi:hypothetical protein
MNVPMRLGAQLAVTPECKMNAARLKEIMAHAEVLFKPEWSHLRDRYEQDSKEARSKALKSGNSAAMFPAEAECHIAYIKAIVVVKANCLASAYRSFHEPAGPEADAELSSFFTTVVAARKSGFAGHAALVGTRTGRSTSQVPYLLRGFERDASVALLEGRRILDKQRVEMTNMPKQSGPQIVYNVSGQNSRITINGADNSSNAAVVNSVELFQQFRAEIKKQIPEEPIREQLVRSIEEVEQATSKESAIGKYDKFATLAAKYVALYTSLSPYLLQLKQWLAQRPW